MNASSKGVALGIFHKDKDTDYVAGSSQPYVELMGRKPVRIYLSSETKTHYFYRMYVGTNFLFLRNSEAI